MPFEVTTKTSQTFGQKRLGGLSKLHSSCPKKRFLEEKHFLEKLIAFSFIFGFWIETIKSSADETSSGLPVLSSNSWYGIFWKKTLRRGKLFYLFQNLRENRSVVRKTFLAADLNCIKHIQRIFFEIFHEVRWPMLSILNF